MTVKSEKGYVGTSTQYLYYWDSKYGWIHWTERELIKEAFERFKKEDRLILGQPVDGWISGLDWAGYIGEDDS